MLRAYPVNPEWTHAGGVAYRERAGRHEILLVRAKPAPHDWVFPKGHIDRGEAPHECARRELREEAGVDAEPIDLVGEDEFTTSSGKEVRVVFFLMRYVADVPAEENREHRWCTVADALRRIRFERGREIVRTAEARFDERS